MILAQFNIGRIRFPLHDPRMADFTDNVRAVNAAGDRMPGFVWRLQDASGTAVGLNPADPALLPNLTLWKDEESLARFVYGSVHRRFIARAAEWFEPIKGPKNVLWMVPADLRPDMAAGFARLEHLREHGPTPHAFSFSFKSLNTGANHVAAQ